jgi:hypothetical protein
MLLPSGVQLQVVDEEVNFKYHILWCGFPLLDGFCNSAFPEPNVLQQSAPGDYMPQMIPVILTDNSATDHTFQPRGPDTNGVQTLVRSTGVPLGDERLTISRSRTAQGREKAVMKLTIPVVSTVTEGGVEKSTVLRTGYADVSFAFDSTSTIAERANARKMIADFLSGSEGIAPAVIDNLENLF